MKKGDIQSRTVIYIISAVIVILLLIALLIFVKNIREKQRKLLLDKAGKELKDTVDTLDFGSKEEKCLDIPESSEVCFFDLNQIEKIIKSPLIDRYPLIKDSLLSGVVKNLFIISGDKTESYYIGDVCLDHYPYFSCLKPIEDQLCVFLEGKGNCALLVQDLKLCTVPPLSPVDDTTGNVIEDFILGNSIASISFKTGTQIKYINEELREKAEICIEPVEFPANGLISEVYNITPIDTQVSPPVELSLMFFPELLKPGDVISNVKLKQYDEITKWQSISPTIFSDTYTIKGNINKFTYSAVFGPEPPQPEIKIKNEGTGTEILPIDNIYIADVLWNLEFKGSATDPDGDINPPTGFKWDLGDGTIIEDQDMVTHTYNEIGSPTVTLTVTDEKGNTGTKQAELHLVSSGNKKNPDKYKNNPIFIIQDTSNNDILRLIPLAMWDGYLGDVIDLYDYPLLPYHTESVNIDDYKLDELKTKYPSSSEIVAFGETPQEIIDSGKVTTENFENYFSYWSEYNDIVVLKESDINIAGIMSALYASFLNAPLYIFTDTPECSFLNGKIVHFIIGGGDFSACSTSDLIIRSLSDISNPTINPYERLYGNFIPAGGIT